MVDKFWNTSLFISHQPGIWTGVCKPFTFVSFAALYPTWLLFTTPATRKCRGMRKSRPLLKTCAPSACRIWIRAVRKKKASQRPRVCCASLRSRHVFANADSLQISQRRWNLARSWSSTWLSSCSPRRLNTQPSTLDKYVQNAYISVRSNMIALKKDLNPMCHFPWGQDFNWCLKSRTTTMLWWNIERFHANRLTEALSPVKWTTVIYNIFQLQ